MHRYPLLLHLLLALPTILHAQHEISIPPIPQCPGEGHVLKEVFVATAEEVGTVLKGPFNRPGPAVISPDIRTAFFEAISGNCDPRPDARPIAIKVNVLAVYEVSTSNEFAMDVLNIDVLREEDGKWVHWFNSGGTKRSHGLDVTHHHGRNISKLLAELLQGLDTLRTGVKYHFPELAEAHLERPTNERDLWLPFLHSPFPKGLFRTFNDMRLGRTIELPPGHPLHDSDVHKQAAYLKKEIWGYSDGKYVHVLFGKKPIRLQREGNDLVGIVHLTEYDPGAVLVGGFMFGVVGGVVANAATMREHEIPVILDVMTGDLMEDHDASQGSIDRMKTGLEEPEPDVSHIIYLSRYSKSDGTLMVLDGDRVVATLGRDTYCEFFFHANERPKRLEVESSTGERLELLLPLQASGSTVHLIQLDKEGRPVQKPVKQQMKEKLLSSLKEEQRRPLTFDPQP